MPSSQAQTDPLATWLADTADTTAATLASAGELHEQRLDGRVDGAIFSVASVPGEKEQNQDAVAVWVPAERSSVHWIAAVADGVSACLHPEHASRLACLEGIAAVEAGALTIGDASPVRAAQRRFDQLACLVDEGPDAMRPPRMTASMWKRVVRDGAFAQTTLLVAWEDDAGLQIEGVGDGGFLVMSAGESDERLPLSDRPVCCLGPGRNDTRPDYRHSYPHWSRFAAFTDGLTPWARENTDALLAVSGGGGEEATASRFVECCLGESNVRDNVTLLIAEREAS